VAGFGLPLLVSTGMADLEEVRVCLRTLREAGGSDITLLHCNTEYPTPMRDVNLKAMAAMGKKFGLKFGYSDHTAGITVPVAAAALGAEVIEKHLTLDNKMKGPDHKASLEPAQANSITAMLKSPQTAVHLVTLLEEMPVQETVDTIAELRAVGMPIGGVVVNQVREEIL